MCADYFELDTVYLSAYVYVDVYIKREAPSKSPASSLLYVSTDPDDIRIGTTIATDSEHQHPQAHSNTAQDKPRPKVLGTGRSAGVRDRRAAARAIGQVPGAAGVIHGIGQDAADGLT